MGLLGVSARSVRKVVCGAPASPSLAFDSYCAQASTVVTSCGRLVPVVDKREVWERLNTPFKYRVQYALWSTRHMS